MTEKLMSKKKPSYAIAEPLYHYLHDYNRTTQISVFYEDLLRFSGAVTVYDRSGQDTLWVRVIYPEYERADIEYSLKKIYLILHSDGSEDSLPYLTVDEIDFCTFGNSKPFRVKIRNILNDSFTYFYIKIADASRIYGLEFEHILSPNRINFLVYKNTLIEEHISGIPGDVFIRERLPDCDEYSKTQLAKQFVKFNERCMLRLLGDMRSYNYVIIPTHDFDHVEYRIRAIDFDQQCYEGNFKVYRPQFFKENNAMVQLVSERLRKESVEQYRKEERSLMAKRLLNAERRYRKLLDCMIADTISTPANTDMLGRHLFEFTHDTGFRHCTSMGKIVDVALDFVRRNYQGQNVVKD